MDNAGYIALSRQRGLFRQMEMVANNVANVDSTGYKADGMMFRQHLVDAGNREKVAFTHDVSSYKNMEQGQLVATHRDLDLAINGEGFFAVNTPLGVRYTRAGNFVLRSDGTIVTTQGYEVMGEGGQPVTIQEEDEQIVVREDGTVTVGTENDERGKLQIMRFDNPQQLQKLPGGYFKTDAQAIPVTEEESTIMQGMLEKSNVNPVQEMVRMMTISRGVGSVTKMMSDLHDVEIRTIQTYGRQQ